jgi:hypothetical protein
MRQYQRSDAASPRSCLVKYSRSLAVPHSLTCVVGCCSFPVANTHYLRFRYLGSPFVSNGTDSVVQTDRHSL